MSLNTEEWLNSLVIRELKEELDKRGLKTTGKSKGVLVDRLSEYVAKHGREIVPDPNAPQPPTTRQNLRPRASFSAAAPPDEPLRASSSTRRKSDAKGKRKQPVSSESASAESYDAGDTGPGFGSPMDSFGFAPEFSTPIASINSPADSDRRSSRRRGLGAASSTSWQRGDGKADEQDEEDGDEEDEESDLQEERMIHEPNPELDLDDQPPSAALNRAAGGISALSSSKQGSGRDSSISQVGSPRSELGYQEQQQIAGVEEEKRVFNVDSDSPGAPSVDTPMHSEGNIVAVDVKKASDGSLQAQENSTEQQHDRKDHQLQQMIDTNQYMFDTMASPTMGSFGDMGQPSALSQSSSSYPPAPPAAPHVPRRSQPPPPQQQQQRKQRSQSTSAASSSAAANTTATRVYLVPTGSFPQSMTTSKADVIGGQPHAEAVMHQQLPQPVQHHYQPQQQHYQHHSQQMSQAPARHSHQNPFQYLQAFAACSAQNLPLEGAIAAMKHAEMYLGAIRDRLTLIAERRAQAVIQQQQQQRLLQRRASQQHAIYAGTGYPAVEPGVGPPVAKRSKPNEMILDLPVESPLLPPRSDSMTIHIVYSTVFKRGSREIKLGNLNRSMPGPLDAFRVLEHDDAASALSSVADGDIMILLEGTHCLSQSIDNKRLEIVGLAPHGNVIVTSDDSRAPQPTVNVGINSAIRVFNILIQGSQNLLNEAVLVHERSLVHLENSSIHGGAVGLLVLSQSSAVIQNSSFTETRSSAIKVSTTTESISIDNSNFINCCYGVTLNQMLVQIPATIRRGCAAVIEMLASQLSEDATDSELASSIRLTIKLSNCKIVDNWGPVFAVRTASNPREQELNELCDGIYTLPSFSKVEKDRLPRKSRIYGALLRQIEVVSTVMEANSKTQIRARLEPNPDYDTSDPETAMARQIVRHCHEDEQPYVFTVAPSSSVADADIAKDRCRNHNHPWMPVNSPAAGQTSWWRCSFDPSMNASGGESGGHRCILGIIRSGIALKIAATLSWPTDSSVTQQNQLQSLDSSGLVRPCPLCPHRTVNLDSSTYIINDVCDEAVRHAVAPRNVFLCERGHIVAESAVDGLIRTEQATHETGVESLAYMM